MAMTPEAKAAADKAAAELKQLNELIVQLKIQWQLDHGAQNFSATEELMFTEKAKAQLATEAKQATEAKALADADAAVPLSDTEKALKRAVSKAGAAFKGSRFEFVGAVFEKGVEFLIKLMPAFKAIIPMIQNVSTMFNPAAAGANKTPVERVKGLVDAGNLEDANDLLQREDLKLIHDMEKAFESDQDVQEFQEHEEQLKGCCQELKTLENNLERLATLKLADDKTAVAAQLETIRTELKEMREHHATLSDVVTAAGDSLKNLPIIFQSMGSILEATQKLCDKEVAELPRPAAPPAAPNN